MFHKWTPYSVITRNYWIFCFISVLLKTTFNIKYTNAEYSDFKQKILIIIFCIYCVNIFCKTIRNNMFLLLISNIIIFYETYKLILQLFFVNIKLTFLLFIIVFKICRRNFLKIEGWIYIRWIFINCFVQLYFCLYIKNFFLICVKTTLPE